MSIESGRYHVFMDGCYMIFAFMETGYMIKNARSGRHLIIFDVVFFGL